MTRRIIPTLLFLGFAWGQGLSPYISPGIQIGMNSNQTLFFSSQITIGLGYQIGKNFQDTLPLWIGRTLGIRVYHKNGEKPKLYRYYDNQISTSIGGMGMGKLINSHGEAFKKNKYWIGAFGLVTYEKIIFSDKIEKQYGLFGVIPIPLELNSSR
jgi:hypothetical protein